MQSMPDKADSKCRRGKGKEGLEQVARAKNKNLGAAGEDTGGPGEPECAKAGDSPWLGNIKGTLLRFSH
jgi:hypothetical protein